MFDIVAKPFKSNGMLFEVGSVITDPTLIRRYLLKLREGKVLRVDLDNEKSKVRFDKLVLKHNLNVDVIFETAGIKAPSAKKPATKKKKQTKDVE
jgi:hypothetical protein